MNWSKHFRTISRNEKGQAEFGTVAGQYTVAELKDLLAAKDASMTALASQVVQFFSTWQKQNPSDANAWHAQYASLLSNYAKAKSNANLVIGGASMGLLPDSVIPADDTYKAVLTALNSAWAQNTNANGSLGDLLMRLSNAGAQNSPVNIPQPQAADFDLNNMQRANTIANQVPSPVKAFVGAFDPNVIPKDATAPQYDPESFVKNHWKELGIGGVLLVVTLKILSKVGI